MSQQICPRGARNEKQETAMRGRTYRDAGLRDRVLRAREEGHRDGDGTLRRRRGFTVRRATVVLPRRVGWRVRIPTGRGWRTRTVKSDRVGFRFGEFVPTKRAAGSKRRRGRRG